ALNKEIVKVNPQAQTAELKYRIRGSVRDDLWQRKPNMVIRVFEKTLDGESAQPLVTKKNHNNGFFDIVYDAPIDTNTGKTKENFHLTVKLFEPVDANPVNDVLVDSQIHYNVNRIHWVNFTQGGETYKGDSDFIVILNTLQKVAGATKVEDIKETAANK